MVASCEISFLITLFLTHKSLTCCSCRSLFFLPHVKIWCKLGLESKCKAHSSSLMTAEEEEKPGSPQGKAHVHIPSTPRLISQLSSMWLWWPLIRSHSSRALVSPSSAQRAFQMRHGELCWLLRLWLADETGRESRAGEIKLGGSIRSIFILCIISSFFALFLCLLTPYSLLFPYC